MDLQVTPEGIYIPQYASAGAAGLDLSAKITSTVKKGEVTIVPTGISMSIPEGCMGLATVRSSIARRGIIAATGAGIIDSDYRGEISFALTSLVEDSVTLVAGERIGQVVILPYERCTVREVSALGTTERGDGGWGSTGQ